MTLIVQTDEGIDSANSYADLTFADAHLALSGTFDGWDALDTDVKESYLIYASFHVDDMFTWRGYPILDYPGLRFPRTEIYDTDNRTITGVPRLLKEAVAELAFYFSQNDPFADNEQAGIAEMEIDTLRIVFSENTRDQKIRYPTMVMSKLSQLGDGTVGGRRVVNLRVR